MKHIVLLEPEMPANTGNIGRTCVATGSFLHLIEPLGFHLDEKSIRRAGLDYWDKLNYRRYINLEEFLELNHHPRLYMVTTKAKRTYTDVIYDEEAYLMFGKESAGIPEKLLVANEENCVRIPMLSETRSLNLSNAVSIVLYEALRQKGFEGLELAGDLHRLSWEKKISH